MIVTALTATCGAVLLGAVSVLAYDATVPRSWPGVVGAYLLVSAGLTAWRLRSES